MDVHWRVTVIYVAFLWLCVAVSAQAPRKSGGSMLLELLKPRGGSKVELDSALLDPERGSKLVGGLSDLMFCESVSSDLSDALDVFVGKLKGRHMCEALQASGEGSGVLRRFYFSHEILKRFEDWEGFECTAAPCELTLAQWAGFPLDAGSEHLSKLPEETLLCIVEGHLVMNDLHVSSESGWFAELLPRKFWEYPCVLRHPTLWIYFLPSVLGSPFAQGLNRDSVNEMCATVMETKKTKEIVYIQSMSRFFDSSYGAILDFITSPQRLEAVLKWHTKESLLSNGLDEILVQLRGLQFIAHLVYMILNVDDQPCGEGATDDSDMNTNTNYNFTLIFTCFWNKRSDQWIEAVKAALGWQDKPESHDDAGRMLLEEMCKCQMNLASPAIFGRCSDKALAYYWPFRVVRNRLLKLCRDRDEKDYSTLQSQDSKISASQPHNSKISTLLPQHSMKMLYDLQRLYFGSPIRGVSLPSAALDDCYADRHPGLRILFRAILYSSSMYSERLQQEIKDEFIKFCKDAQMDMVGITSPRAISAADLNYSSWEAEVFAVCLKAQPELLAPLALHIAKLSGETVFRDPVQIVFKQDTARMRIAKALRSDYPSMSHFAMHLCFQGPGDAICSSNENDEQYRPSSTLFQNSSCRERPRPFRKRPSDADFKENPELKRARKHDSSLDASIRDMACSPPVTRQRRSTSGVGQPEIVHLNNVYEGLIRYFGWEHIQGETAEERRARDLERERFERYAVATFINAALQSVPSSKDEKSAGKLGVRGPSSNGYPSQSSPRFDWSSCVPGSIPLHAFPEKCKRSASSHKNSNPPVNSSSRTSSTKSNSAPWFVNLRNLSSYIGWDNSGTNSSADYGESLSREAAIPHYPVPSVSAESEGALRQQRKFIEDFFQLLDLHMANPTKKFLVEFKDNLWETSATGDGLMVEALNLFGRLICLPHHRILVQSKDLDGMIPYPLLDRHTVELIASWVVLCGKMSVRVPVRFAPQFVRCMSNPDQLTASECGELAEKGYSEYLAMIKSVFAQLEQDNATGSQDPTWFLPLSFPDHRPFDLQKDRHAAPFLLEPEFLNALSERGVMRTVEMKSANREGYFILVKTALSLSLYNSRFYFVRCLKNLKAREVDDCFALEVLQESLLSTDPLRAREFLETAVWDEGCERIRIEGRSIREAVTGLVQSLSAEQFKRLLWFVTGSVDGPAGGLSSRPIRVHAYWSYGAACPSASTCAFVLNIPVFSTLSETLDRLMFYIECADGFVPKE